MKKTSWIGFVALFVIMVFGSVWVDRIAAAEQFLPGEVKLIAHDPVPDAEFGRSVAIAEKLVAVGAGGANAGSVAKAGAVYVFKRQGLTLCSGDKTGCTGCKYRSRIWPCCGYPGKCGDRWSPFCTGRQLIKSRGCIRVSEVWGFLAL